MVLLEKGRGYIRIFKGNLIKIMDYVTMDDVIVSNGILVMYVILTMDIDINVSKHSRT